MKLTQEEWIRKAKEIHGNKYDYSKVEYKGSHEKVKIICNNCGKEFIQEARAHINGAGCRECSMKKVWQYNHVSRNKDQGRLTKDGIELIQKYNDKNAFIYADPPYVLSTRGTTRYRCDMSEEQQKKFLGVCINTEAKILISGYDCDEYNILTENGFTKKQFTNNNNVETLWKNY